MLRRVFALMKKEFKVVWNDPKSKRLLFMPPLMQLLVFAQAVTMEVKNIDLGILDHARSMESAELISKFQHAQNFRHIIVLESEKEIEEKIILQEISAALTLDMDFSKNLKQGNASDVQLILDGRQTNSASTIQAYVSEVLALFGAEFAQKMNLTHKKIAMQGAPTSSNEVNVSSIGSVSSVGNASLGRTTLSENETGDTSSNLASTIMSNANSLSSSTNSTFASSTLSSGLANTANSASIQVRSRFWFNPNLDYSPYLLVTLSTILSVIITLVLTALSLAREKELGTYEQLLVSPLSTNEILFAKLVPPILLGVLLSSIMFVIIVFVYKIAFTGSLFLYYGATILSLFWIAALGLFISTICKNQQQSILGAFTVMIPCVLLSGFISPIASMPEPLQYLTYANPLRFYLLVTRGIFLKDMPIEAVLQGLIPVLILGLICLIMASIILNKSRS